MKRRLIPFWTLLGIGLLLSLSMNVWADQGDGNIERKTVSPSLNKVTRLALGDSELEIPAGATEQEISAEIVDLDLEDIDIPYTFRAVSKIYRFGPHGMKFAKGKELKFNLKLNDENQCAQLYYINREKKRLQRVIEQKFSQKTGKLEAKLQHFSDYVLGVQAGWDGNGINPFMDYVHNGEESISLSTLILTARSQVYSLPQRGGNVFNLARAFSLEQVYDKVDEETEIKPLEGLEISQHWYWDLPFMHFRDNSKMIMHVNVPGKGSYTLDVDGRVAESMLNSGWKWTNFDGVSLYTHVYRTDEGKKFSSIVYISDGTKIEYGHNCEIITYPNGSTIKYNLEKYYINNILFGKWDERIDSIEDEMGRKIDFTYSGRDLVNAILYVSNFPPKVIFSRRGKNPEVFVDVLNRQTTYYYDEQDVNIKKIEYNNGVISEFQNRTHTHYDPNTSKCYSTIYKVLEIKLADNGRFQITKIQLDYGNKIKTYNLSYQDILGYTLNEYTYSSSMKLLKQVNYAYYWVETDDNKGVWPKTVTTRYPKMDGTFGEASTYEYAYDNVGNQTWIKSPNGSETRFAYANTNSQPKLSLLSPANPANLKYQDSIYTPNFSVGWNKPITKATFIVNPLDPGNPKLKQTHYQYDAKGNLIQESEVYGSGYLNTTYTYDAYGNVLTKTDANGNTLCFAYKLEAPYNSAFLTRVYKPDNTTIATFDYNVVDGTKTMATDPKGNTYRYQYDAIGRLTKEWLENIEPELNISREIEYDDINSIVTLRFGKFRIDGSIPTDGMQEGKIVYSPLFGKPEILQRKVNNGWETVKTFEYDSNGRLIVEKDGMGHTTTYEYDPLDRKINTTFPNMSHVTNSWDDRVLTIIDANQNRKIQKYDVMDRLVETVEYPTNFGEPYVTRYEYDSFEDPSTDKVDSHLVQVTNPRGAATKYTYDNLGRLIQVDYPQDGANPMQSEMYTYDNAGNLKTKTDAKGTKVIDYEFFAGYRVKTVTEPDGRVITYTYDNNDNPLSQAWKANPSGAETNSYSYTYNARNQVETMTANLDNFTFGFIYDYDVFGRVIGISYPGRSETLSYNYDELDRLVNIPGFINAATYDGDNKLTELSLINGLYNTYTYDNNDRPVNIGASQLGIKAPIESPNPQVFLEGPNIEVEEMALTDFVAQNNAVASSGKVVSNSTNRGIANYNFTGETGNYNLTVYYFDENDGEAEFVIKQNGIIIDQWVANGRGSTALTQVSRTVPLSLGTNDLLTIESIADEGDLGKIDNLSLKPSVTLVKVGNDFASESYQFNGVTGNYDLSVSYYDNNVIGNNVYQIMLNGEIIDEWRGTNGIGWKSRVRRMNLKNGDVILIKLSSSYSFINLGDVTVTPVDSMNVESEMMTLTNYWIEDNSASSGGKFITTKPGKASASFVYNGAAGLYDLIINYFDENDGLATFAVKVNGNLIGQWVSDKNLGDGISSATLTNYTVNGVSVNTNDLITIESTINGGDLGSIDNLLILKSSGQDVSSYIRFNTVLPRGALTNLNYQYDPSGNITRINGDYYAYDGLNRLIWAGNLPMAEVTGGKTWGRGTVWSYDGAGNRTGQQSYLNGQLQESITLGYDLANRLWSKGAVTYTNDAAGSRISKNDGTTAWNYIYDGESRMIQASKDGATLLENSYDGAGMRVKKVNNGKTTYFVYSGSNPLLEYDPATGKYTYFIYAGQRSVAEEKDGKKTFYHRDHLGSTRAMTDDTGKITGLSKYDAWGKLESTNAYDEGIINGDLELTTALGTLINWTPINDQPEAGDCSYRPTEGMNGSAALRIDRNTGGAGTGWVLPNIYASPDTDYQLTGYFLSGNEASTKARVSLVYYNPNGEILATHDSGPLGHSGAGWKEFTLASHAPLGAVTMEIRLTQDADPGMVVLFDGIRLKIPGLKGEYDYTGKREDEGTGLKYFGARFYDYDSGRFLTADSFTYLPNDERIIFKSISNEKAEEILNKGIQHPIYQNRFIYCHDNPLNKIDPDGHNAIVAVAIGVITVAALVGYVNYMKPELERAQFLNTLGKYYASRGEFDKVAKIYELFQDNRASGIQKTAKAVIVFQAIGMFDSNALATAINVAINDYKAWAELAKQAGVKNRSKEEWEKWKEEAEKVKDSLDSDDNDDENERG